MKAGHTTSPRWAVPAALALVGASAQPPHDVQIVSMAAPPGTVAVLTSPDGSPLPYAEGHTHRVTMGVPIHDGSHVWAAADGRLGWSLDAPSYSVVFMMPPPAPRTPIRNLIPWTSGGGSAGDTP